MWFNTNCPFFKKVLIAYNISSRRDTKKLKTPSQDTSNYVSGDLEKSILKFDPRSWLSIVTHVFFLLSYRKYIESKWSVFPLSEACGIRIQLAHHHTNQKQCFSAPPPSYWTLTLAMVGGPFSHPCGFSRIAGKRWCALPHFGIPAHTSISHHCRKFQHKIISGQVTRSGRVTIPQKYSIAPWLQFLRYQYEIFRR